MHINVLSIITYASIAGVLVGQQQPDQQQLQVNQIGQAAVPVLRDGSQPFAVFRAADGNITAEGSRFQAQFDRSGVALSTPAAKQGDELPRLELTFLGSQRGWSQQPATTDLAPNLNDNFVRYHRGNVVETYEVKPTGYEQTFHINQVPAGQGDLILAIAAGGNVHAEAQPARHQAIEFSHGDARAIRYSEAFAYDRAGTRVNVMTSYDGQGRIELTVPKSFLETAIYPVVVDPSVGAVFNPGGPTWNDLNPDVAYDPISEHYMVVWQRQFSASSIAIRGQVYDEDGATVGFVQAITSSATVSREPAVAFCQQPGATGFLVVWQEGNLIRGQLRSAATGTALASSFDISDNVVGKFDRRPTVAGPDAMIVAWDRTYGSNPQPTEIGAAAISFPVVGQPGTVSSTWEETIESVSGGAHVRNPRLAQSNVQRISAGTNWTQNRLVWQRWYTSPAPGDWDCRTASIRFHVGSNSFEFVQSPTGVSGGSAIGPNELTPAIAARASRQTNPTDTQYCIAWEGESSVFGRMYSETNATGSVFTVRDTANYEGMPSVAAGFCEFTVAYGEIIPPNEFAVDIRAARVLLDGTVAVTDRAVDLLGGPYQANLRSASRPIRDSGKETNTTLLTWYGATGPANGLNDVRARFFEPVVPNDSLFGVACPGPLGELAQIGSAGGSAIAGSPDFRLTIASAPANSLAVLLISPQLTTTAIPGAPGCSLYAGLPFLSVLPTFTDAAGSGFAPLPMPCSIPSGFTLAFQWGIYTPGHNAFGWIVSNDMDINWSHF